LLPLPKTANPEHMKINAAVDFVISDADMKTLKNNRTSARRSINAFAVLHVAIAKLAAVLDSFAIGTLAHKRAHTVAARGKKPHQMTADKTCSPGNKGRRALRSSVF